MQLMGNSNDQFGGFATMRTSNQPIGGSALTKQLGLLSQADDGLLQGPCLCLRSQGKEVCVTNWFEGE